MKGVGFLDLRKMTPKCENELLLCKSLSMSMIFISYRRKDCTPEAIALAERLSRHHPGQVFLDVFEMLPGDEVDAKIKAHLQQCRVLLALIGPSWQNVRLHDDDDWVRHEIVFALEQGVRVVPVLIDDAPKLERRFLPKALHPLVGKLSMNLDIRNRFNQDVDYLLRKVIDPVISIIPTPVDENRREFDAIEAMRRKYEVAQKSLIRPQDISPPKMMNLTLSTPENSRLFPELRQCLPMRPPEVPWASDFGFREDGELAWADLRVGKVVQRLRWIAPGSFMMGDASIGPAHSVRITKGFWLADTACTEEFWSAVIGCPAEKTSNDAKNPVRYVSWGLIQEKFLTSLNRRLNSMEASVIAKLPSEAQWEYACRAGGREDFSFKPEKVETKKSVSKKQVNCNGWHGQVVAAKHFDPNPWGLYQMHGNVWEWCRDAHRVYVMDVVQNDPLGDENGYTSVLKGGSWRDHVFEARSAACRYRELRSYSGDDVGFRFLLESC